MGTITTPSGYSCGVSTPDQVINQTPGLRTFLSKSLDVATKAKKTTAQVRPVLEKQIATVKSNPQRYTPQALQQCTVNLDKAAAQNPGVDVLESLTNTGYMPPEADVPISGGTATGAAANAAAALSGATQLERQLWGGETAQNTYATTFTTPQGEFTFIPSSIVEKGLVSPDGTTYLFTDFLNKDKLTQFFSKAQKVDLSTVPHSGITSLGNSWGDWVTGRTGQSADGYLIPGRDTIFSPSANLALPTSSIGAVKGISKDEAGNYVYATSGGRGNQYITGTGEIHDPQITYHSVLGDILGVDPVALQQVVAIAQMFVAPELGASLAAELGVSNVVGNALVNIGMQVASGKDFESALQDSITSAVAQGATGAVAGQISEAAKGLDFDPKGALVGAAGAAILAGVKTTLQGGSSKDIVDSILAGAAGGATAAETGSMGLGGAVAGGLKSGTMGALSGAASGLGQAAAWAGRQASSLGIPIPPGGKVGVTWSVDGSGNALVMYSDGQTDVVSLPAGTPVGSTITFDPSTNSAQVTALPSIAGIDRLVAGPYRVEMSGVGAVQESPGGVTREEIPTGYRLATTNEATYLQDKGFSATTLPNGELAWIIPDTPSGLRELAPGGDISRPGVGKGIYVAPTVGAAGEAGGAAGPAGVSYFPESGIPKLIAAYQEFMQTSKWPAGILSLPDVQPYVKQYQLTGQWPKEVMNAIAGTAPGWQKRRGVSGGGGVGAGFSTQEQLDKSYLSGLETAVGTATGKGGTSTGTAPQGISIPDQFGGTYGFGGTGRGAGAGGAGGAGGFGGGGEWEGGISAPLPEEGSYPKDETTTTATAAEKTPGAEPTTSDERAQFLISGGVSRKPKGGTMGRGAATALQTPFTSSLLTSGLTSYRGAGEIESPESGKKRSNVWNEASLRLKDALGI